MNDFYTVLKYLNEKIYEPNDLFIKSVQEEKQNAKYGAGSFQVSSRTIRFRVSQQTPTKAGQFVAFWEKGEENKNQPYAYETAPDLFVVTAFKNNREFGQFVFPKEVLLKQNVLSSISTKGKMAIRVYPSWDTPSSKQALKTQKWQSPYFIDMSNMSDANLDKIRELYVDLKGND